MKATRLHLGLTLFWALLTLPTVLWWRESILWIALMSIYSIIVGHWGAFEAAKADERLRKERRGLKDITI